ncbi:hypothetical protein ACFORL_04770 [Legionella dresdenensis]|uniref:Uncharacterized protein n=1 Tax=Legionella dresdenensis TaxID=450200 RepID=A0ABV8CDL7_9GAMM
MFKKIILGLLISSAAGSSFANETLCGYKDFFHLGNSTDANVYIYSFLSDGDILLYPVGPRSFIIEDGEDCRKGHGHVTFTHPLWGSCVLDITDGPYMSHPTVEASCNGYMRFAGMTYDGYKTYSYTINFVA